MAIQTTRWSPDTCGCVHEYTWDDAVPVASRTHTFSNAVVVCPQHQALGLSGKAAHDAALENNLRKNNAIGSAQAIRAGLSHDNVSWAWDAQRNLTITITGISLTGAQRNAIQTALNTRFGAGKVTLA